MKRARTIGIIALGVALIYLMMSFSGCDPVAMIGQALFSPVVPDFKRVAQGGVTGSRLIDIERSTGTPDTVVEVRYDTVRITEIRSEIHYRDTGMVVGLDARGDTALVGRPFEAPFAGVDSATGGKARGRIALRADSTGMAQLLVEDLEVECPPSMAMTIDRTDTLKYYIDIPDPWYERPAIAVGGAIIGYLLRMITEGKGNSQPVIINSADKISADPLSQWRLGNSNDAEIRFTFSIDF